MKLRGALAALASVVCLTSCATELGDASEGSLVSQPDSEATAAEADDAQTTYLVPTASCPTGWTGLQVTADHNAKVTDLDDLVACTDKDENRTYLENRSRVVWLLSAATVTPSVSVRKHAGPGETSFLRIVRRTRGQEAMAPGSALTVLIAPNEVTWAPDLPLTYGWEGHALIVARLLRIGQAYATDALNRQNWAGVALAECTKAVDGHATSVRALPRAEPAKVLLDGLATRRCRTAAAGVALTDELNELRSNAKLIRAATTSITSASASALALPVGARLGTRSHVRARISAPPRGRLPSAPTRWGSQPTP